MMAPNRISALLLLLAAGLLAWLLLRKGPESESERPGPAAGPAAPTPERPAPVPAMPATASSGRATAPAPAAAGGAESDEPPAPPVDFPEGPAAAGEVVGVVLLLPDRTPVAGAGIRLLGGGPGPEVAPRPDPDHAVTGGNGVFRMRGFAAGAYLFDATLAGHGARLFRVVVPAESGAGGVEVLFGSGGAVEGRVDGPEGPAAGLRVRINRSGISGGPGLLSTVTNADGEYRLEDLEPGDYGVELDDGRRAAVSVAASGVARLDFPAGGSLAGLVTDVDGSPLVGAIVRLRTSGGGYASTQTETGEDGGYRIPSAPPGPVVVGVQVLGDQGFAVDLVATTLAPGENRLDLDLRNPEWAGEISGRVFDASTGAALGKGKTQISLRYEAPAAGEEPLPDQSLSMAFADDGGNFRFRCLRAGRYRLTVYSFAGHVAADREIELARGERKTGLEIGLQPAPAAAKAPEPAKEDPHAATLSGRVLDAEGLPLASAYVRAYAASDPRRYRQGSTDGTGAYLIRGLDAGIWRIEVQVVGADSFATGVGNVEIAPGENSFDVRLGQGDLAGEIRGRVFEGATGRALSAREVQVILYLVGPDGKENYAGLAFADAKGDFRLRYVRSGRCLVKGWPTPSASGLKETKIELTMAPGEVKEGVELAMDGLRTGRVRFTVKDEAGAPVLYVAIRAVRDGKQEQGSMDSNSASGVYTASFEIGPHDVTITDKKGDLTWTGHVDVREGEAVEVEAVLRPADARK